MSKPPERKKLTPRGIQIKATKLLTDCLREIGGELHDVLDSKNDSVTKVEWLARHCWDRATGYVEKHIDDTGRETEIRHQPDRAFISMIWERLEGKVAPVVKDGDKKAKVADKIAEQSKKRANRLADEH
jgi:hypothetical protein